VASLWALFILKLQIMKQQKMKTSHESGRMVLVGLACCLFLFLVSSCRKQELPEARAESDFTEVVAERASQATTYVLWRGMSLNNYQSAPTRSVTYGSTTYYGGPFVSAVSATSNSGVTFTVKRTDGLTFPSGSVIKVKSAGVGVNSLNSNAGSPAVATKTLTAAASTVTIPVSESFSYSHSGNFKNYVVTWYNPASGYNFYTKFICVVAVPEGWGNYLTSLDGIKLYSNGYGGFAGTDSTLGNGGQMYQCVELPVRYYAQVKNKTIQKRGADMYWNYPTSIGFTTKVANGSGIPQRGDVLCLHNTSNNHYHVGVIDGVRVTGKIRVYQQNVGSPCVAYFDFPYTRSSNGNYTILQGSPSGYVVKGWVR
jgi:hypothetical protein